MSGGFVHWTIWKERNERVFRSKKRITRDICGIIKQNIREPILVGMWLTNDWKVEGSEVEILKEMDLA